MSGFEGRFSDIPSDAQLYQRPKGDVQHMSGLEGQFPGFPDNGQAYQRPEGDVQLMSGSRVGYTPEHTHTTDSRTMWIVGIILVVLVLMSLVVGFMMMMR